MKKFTKILALTLVVIMSVMVLASCAVPAKDPEKAKEALEDAGYDVTITSSVRPGGIHCHPPFPGHGIHHPRQTHR